ncbi:MAG: RNA methyltransferase [Candidatus Acidiferrales bacterium]
MNSKRPTGVSGERITSKDNRWIKQFRAAFSGAGPAEGEPLALEGPKLVEEAVGAGLKIEALLVSESGQQAYDRILLTARMSGHAELKTLHTTDKIFAAIAATETPQGIAALVRCRDWSLEDILRGPANSDGAFTGNAPLVVVLAGVQDPGNVGAIVRSAEAFGATGVIATRGTADPWAQKALRASAGSTLRLPILRGMAAPMVLMQLRVAGVQVLATASRASAASRQSKDLRSPIAIFIGSEGAGLSDDILKAADASISIPISGQVDSLNAAVAAAVLLYEVARQRQAESLIK